MYSTLCGLVRSDDALDYVMHSPSARALRNLERHPRALNRIKYYIVLSKYYLIHNLLHVYMLLEATSIILVVAGVGTHTHRWCIYLPYIIIMVYYDTVNTQQYHVITNVLIID